MNHTRGEDPVTERVRLGISACLLGQPVRYDGKHKRDAFLVDTLGALVEYGPVCPEVEVGMGVPRPTLRLVGHDGGPRLVRDASGEDWTDRMIAWAGARVEALAALDLDGFILKKGSPSCGLERVKLYQPGVAVPRSEGRGLFADVLARRLPDLPLEQEDRLSDPDLREAFFERVAAYRRLKRTFAAGIR